jgi:group I intron endonuclease
MFTIYLIEDHRKKGYVGVTGQKPEKRFREHKNAARGGNDRHLYRAMRKYGIENFNLIVLDVAKNYEEAYELEEEWIESLGTYRDWGYNMTPGGDGAASGKDHHMAGATGEDNPMYGKTRSEEVREAIRQAQTGREKTEKERKEISERMKGNKISATKFCREQIAEMKWLALNSELAQPEIADRYNTNQSYVSHVKTGKRWPEVEPRKPNT